MILKRTRTSKFTILKSSKLHNFPHRDTIYTNYVAKTGIL